MKYLGGRRNRYLLWIAVAAALLLCGCSRSAINYQIAESLGTVGLYENGEPVENPQMKEEREKLEQEESEQEVLGAQLSYAANLAAGYYYREAADYLNGLDRTDSNAQALDEAARNYEEQEASLVTYTGDIGHLCFPTLVEDTSRAFDGDDYAYTYLTSMISTKEFRAILDALYANGYILISLEDVAESITSSRNITHMEMKELRLPAGKKPVIISQDDLNYASVRNGDGVATALVLDDGEVKARYTDAEGHDLKGDYDLIPILNSFIEEHPDFSWRGAKGIVSVSGESGVFGYDIVDAVNLGGADTRETVKEISEALIQSGWKIACAGFSHSYMNEMSVQTLAADITSWMEKVAPYTGSTNILFYPYGGEVAYPSDQLDYLIESGFEYLCGIWTEADFMEAGDKYLRQTRRFVDGYTLVNTPDSFSSYFQVSSILDPDR